MSEYSQSIIANYTISQMPDKSYQVSHSSLVLPHGASEAALETKLKPRFAEFAVSHHEVGLSLSFFGWCTYAVCNLGSQIYQHRS
jgi:hypothetical protein